MFGFNKKIEIKKLEINEAYRNYKKNTDKIMIICVDEVVNFDNLHIEGAECLPFRLLKRFDEYYPEKNIIYYRQCYLEVCRKLFMIVLILFTLV